MRAKRFRPTIEGLECRLSLSGDVALLGGDATACDPADCDTSDTIEDIWNDPWADIGVAEETPDIDPYDPWDDLPDIDGTGPEPPDLEDGQPPFEPLPPAPIGPAGPA